jgi:hypothetical protein
MGTSSKLLPCDGCGLPASPDHIAARVKRLELSTQFRPVHIGVLFVVLAPPARTEDDFYAPAESKEFFDPFLEAMEVPRSTEKSPKPADAHAAELGRLAEFQHRGYYLVYLSECPIRASEEPAATTIARLAPTLLRRIRFNYRPKHIAPLGSELNPLIEIFKGEGIAPIVTQANGLALPAPGTGPLDWLELFRRSVAAAAP